MPAGAQEGLNLETDIDWPAYVAAQDPQWDRLPQSWHESVFVGNGQTGTAWTVQHADGLWGLHSRGMTAANQK